MLIVVPPIQHRKKMKRFTLSIEALCVSLDTRVMHGSHGRRTTVYAPAWEYTFGGVTYVYQETVYSNIGVPNIGEMHQVLIDPVSPGEVYRPVDSMRKISMVMGILFIVMSVIVLFITRLPK